VGNGRSTITTRHSGNREDREEVGSHQETENSWGKKRRRWEGEVEGGRKARGGKMEGYRIGAVPKKVHKSLHAEKKKIIEIGGAVLGKKIKRKSGCTTRRGGGLSEGTTTGGKGERG